MMSDAEYGRRTIRKLAVFGYDHRDGRVRKPRVVGALAGYAPAMDLDHDACYRAISLRDPRFDGRLFTAVKTTGIYCRPICPARTPRSENVVFYPTAAAAQAAGFRPCLRCRPETAPDLGAWKGTSSTVSRALSLIELGALDGGDVDQLAGRLGIGERQLRRLFRQHLGASPIAVAQTRRVLLAKQLIHESDLPMTEIAFASGFGSLRRFNETFQILYGCGPQALRRRTAKSRAAGPPAPVTVRLRYKPPYDWEAMLAHFRARAVPGLEAVAEGTYRRVISVGTLHGSVTVGPDGENALKAAIHFPTLSALPEIIARLRRLFDLAADPEAIGSHLRWDPVLAPLLAARPGLRVPGAWDGLEMALRAVLGQQITVAAARRLAGKLVEAHGERVELGEEGLTHAFPSAASIAAADLAALGMPGSRAATLSAIASASIADPDLFSATSDLEEAVLRLRAISGVGEWTAQYIALRQLREPDAFPAADIGLQRALQDARGRRPTTRELLKRAESWRPWRAYAAQHLWAGQTTALSVG